MTAVEAGIDRVAERIWEAQRAGDAVPLASDSDAGLELERAYRIQDRVIAHWIDDGESPVGWKVGLASAPGRTPDSPGPIYGRLLTGMMGAPGEALEVGRLVAPMAEAEIAFAVGRQLRGPGVTIADVLAACTGVMPAIEVFDARLAPDGGREPSTADWVADNSASARAVVGREPTPPGELDLRLVGMVLWRDGAVARTGAGAHVLGDPAGSVAWLANALAGFGRSLEEGEVVLSGSLAAPLPVAAGSDLTVELDRLGSIEVELA